MRVLTGLGLFLAFLGIAVGSAQAATSPLVLDQGTSSVTASDATLEAQIDPGGAGAYYQFQLAGHPSEFADEIFCPTGPQSKPLVPCMGPESAAALPIGYISHAEGETTVKLDLGAVGESLKPGTTYYFRVVAASAIQTEDTIEWEQPVVGGAEASFDTTKVPTVLDQGTSSVTASDATLEAQIDPGGAGAYYQFQLAGHPSEFADEIFCPTGPQSKPLVPCMGPESAAALPIGYISHAEGETTVKLDLGAVGESLKPGTTYYFRVVAASAIQTEDTIEWEQPVVGGAEASFTTASPCPTELCGGSPSTEPSGEGSAGGVPSTGSGGTTKPRHRLRHRRHHRPRHSSALAVAAAVRVP